MYFAAASSATVTSSPNVTKRTWQILGSCSNKLMSKFLSCLHFANTRCPLAQWIAFHTTVAWSSSHLLTVTVCSNPSDRRTIGESVGCAPSGKKKRAGSTSLLVLFLQTTSSQKRSSRSYHHNVTKFRSSVCRCRAPLEFLGDH